MATSPTSSVASVPYGVITLDGKQYVERFQLFCLELWVTQANQVFTNQRLTMPGTANFLLKGLTRETAVPGGSGIPGQEIFGIFEQRFRFRLMGSEGSTWFFSSGLGIIDDRVVDTMCFGNGQFPFPLIPPVPVHASGSLIFEVEDMGFGPFYPYRIYFGFHGSYLIPVAEASTNQSLVYTVGGN